jgi:hypothetical protein
VVTRCRVDLEQAAALGRDALRTASPPLADLDDRITDFLIRTLRRRDDNASVAASLS